MRKPTNLDVVYQSMGRAPPGGLQITTPEEDDGSDANSLSSQLSGLSTGSSVKKSYARSIFGKGGDGRSIFSFDRSSMFSFSSSLTTKIADGITRTTRGPDGERKKRRRLKNNHNFHDEFGAEDDDEEDGSGSESDTDSGSDSDPDSDDSAATIPAKPVAKPQPKVEPEKPIPSSSTQPIVARQRRPGKFLHSISSGGGVGVPRIQVVLESIGAKETPIFVEGLANVVRGKILINLREEDESVDVTIKGRLVQACY